MSKGKRWDPRRRPKGPKQKASGEWMGGERPKAPEKGISKKDIILPNQWEELLDEELEDDGLEDDTLPDPEQ